MVMTQKLESQLAKGGAKNLVRITKAVVEAAKPEAGEHAKSYVVWDKELILVQKRRNKHAALLRKLLRNLGIHPERPICLRRTGPQPEI
jgi:hypothetical protein